MTTNDNDLIQKIRKYLVETHPDTVEKIKISKKANHKYPDFAKDFIINALKDKQDLHTSYISLEKTNLHKDQLYDLIFNPQEEKGEEKEKEEVQSNTKSKIINCNEESKDENNDTKKNESIEPKTESNDTYNEDLIYFEEEEEEEEFEPINDDEDDYSDIFTNSEHDIIHFDVGELNITNIDDDFITVEEFQKKRDLIIKNVANRLSLTEDAAFLMMKKYNFDYDRFSEDWSKHPDFIDNLPKMINVPREKIKQPLTINKIEGKGFCSICYEEECELYEMYCGHIYCKDCIIKEIEIQIEERKFPVCCREDNCEIMVHELPKFIEENKMKQYMINYLEEQILIDQKYIKCPSPECPLFLSKCNVYCDLGKCKCGQHFCIKCQQISHAPLKCEQIDEWNNKCQMMNQLLLQQEEWKQRELSLWKYRKENIEEIKKISDEHLEIINQEYEEIFQKEVTEIEKIKKSIDNEEIDENEKQSLTYRLNRLISLHDFYQSKKNTEINFFSKFINDYILALNNGDESFLNSMKNSIYIQVNNIQKLVKKCPKCGVIIDKNGGCNHMKCQVCHHEFCWICLQDWTLHKDYYKCIYATNQNNPNDNENSNQNDNQNNNQDDNQNNNQDNNQNDNQNDNQDNNQNNNLDNNQNNTQGNDQYFIRYLRQYDNQNNNQNGNQNNNENDELVQQQQREEEEEEEEQEEEEEEQEEEEEEEEEEKVEEEKYEVPEDHEFRLPPINAKIHFEFERWKRYNNNYNYHIRYIPNIENKRYQHLSNSLSFIYHSILARSYQLLFLIDPSSGTPYNLFEYYVDQLEHISPYRSKDYLETLLKHVNDFFFINRK